MNNDSTQFANQFQVNKNFFFLNTWKQFVTMSRIRHDHFFLNLKTDFSSLSLSELCWSYCIKRRPHQIIVNDFLFIVRAMCLCECVDLLFCFVLFSYFFSFFCAVAVVVSFATLNLQIIIKKNYNKKKYTHSLKQHWTSLFRLWYQSIHKNSHTKSNSMYVFNV